VTTIITVLPPQAAAIAVAALLKQSNSARNLVVAATSMVGDCTEAPSQGIQELQQAITIRNSVLSGIRQVSVSDLPGGGSNSQLLQQAMEASVTADANFVGWMNDIAASHCPVATANDGPYQAAVSASQQATAAKLQFVSWWNPIASQYGLATYAESDL
jgi:hypothetical protein